MPRCFTEPSLYPVASHGIPHLAANGESKPDQSRQRFPLARSPANLNDQVSSMHPSPPVPNPLEIFRATQPNAPWEPCSGRTRSAYRAFRSPALKNQRISASYSRQIPRYAADPSPDDDERPPGPQEYSCGHGTRGCGDASHCGAGKCASS